MQVKFVSQWGDSPCEQFRVVSVAGSSPRCSALSHLLQSLFRFLAEAGNAMFSTPLPKLENKHSVDTAHEKTLCCWNVRDFRRKIKLWFGILSVP